MINIIYLSDYIEFIEIINIIVVLFIILSSVVILTKIKRIEYIAMLLIWTVEIVVIVLEKEVNIVLINILVLLLLMKLLMINVLKKEILLKNKYRYILNVLIMLAVFILVSKNGHFQFINLIINICICKIININRINSKITEYTDSYSKLKHNKKYSKELVQRIERSYILQNELKGNIQVINKKIETALEESEVPICILNFKRQYIQQNKAFEKLLEDISINRNTGIEEFFESYFLESRKAMDKIKNVDYQMTNHINLYSIDNNIYKLTCFIDNFKEQDSIICILKNITQSIKVQNELKESEDRYKTLIEMLNDGIIIQQKNKVNYINNTGKEIFNIKENENISIEYVINQIKVNYRNEFIRNIKRISDKECEEVTTRIITKTNKVIDIITTELVLNNTNMLLNIVIDITDIEIGKLKLEESKKTYERILQLLPEGIVIISKDTREHMYINKTMIEIIKSIGIKEFNNFVNEHIENCIFGEFNQIISKDDEDISMVVIDREEDKNWIVIMRRSENQKAIDIMEEKLIEIKCKNQLKDEFVSRVTEFLDKPINTIYLMNTIMDTNKEKYNSSQIDNHVKLVKQNCYRLKKVLENMSQVQELEKGIYSVDNKKYDVVKLVENIVDLVRTYTNQKNIKVIFTSNVEEEIIICDKEKMEKIILNLISNAIKFTESNGTIEIKIEVKEKIKIIIKDNGIGIPKDKIDSVFENFEQVDRTLSRGAEGIGVGLFLVKQLAQIIGAKVNLESEINNGSVFELELNRSNKNIDMKQEIVSGDKEKIDIEFSDIYLNLNN